MPSLGLLTINALACADSVLVPVAAAYLPVKGLQQLIKTIGRVKRQLYPKLQIEGILLTMVDNRTMLMLLRNVKTILQRYVGQDYTMEGIRGREMHNMTVGIIGAGNIGQTAIRHLVSFECKILYWNRHPKKELEGIAEYCSLQELLERSDIVSLYISSNKETYHFIDEDKFKQMKKGAILVNTARGDIVDTQELIHALEDGTLSGAGLDVFENDRNIYYRDYKNQMIKDHNMAILSFMPNVLMMPHAAYFTDQAIEDMVHNSLIITSKYFELECC